MLAELAAVVDRARSELAEADAGQLEAWRQSYLGRSGQLTSLLRQIGTLPLDQRPAAGAQANAARDALNGAFRTTAARTCRRESGSARRNDARFSTQSRGTASDKRHDRSNPQRICADWVPDGCQPRGGIGRIQLLQAEYPGRPPGPRHVGHVPNRRSQLSGANATAHPYITRPRRG